MKCNEKYVTGSNMSIINVYLIIVIEDRSILRVRCFQVEIK